MLWAHVHRKKAYTVWNQKTGARASNYGSRVDFILAAGPRAPSHSPAAVPGADATSPAAASEATSDAADEGAVAASPVVTLSSAASGPTDTAPAQQVSLDTVVHGGLLSGAR